MATSQELLEQGLNQVITQESGVRDYLGQGGNLGDYSDPTRQLIQESGYISTGRPQTTPQQAPMPYQTGAPLRRDNIYGDVTSAYGERYTPDTARNFGLSDIYSAISGASGPGTSMSPTSDRTSQLQDSLNNINARYESLISQARSKGENQESRVRALSNVGGGLYSNNRFSQQDQVAQGTSDVVRAIEAQRGAEISAAMGADSAAERAAAIDARDFAYKQQQDYVDNLMASYGLTQQEAQTALQRQLAVAGVTGQFEGQNTLEYQRYLSDAANQQFNQGLSERELQMRIDEASRANYQIVQGDNGEIIAINPQNPQDRYSIGNYSAPRYSGGTGSAGGSAGAGGSPLDQIALLRYQQATGSIPNNAVARQAVIDAYLAAVAEAGGGVQSIDPYAMQNPFPSERYSESLYGQVPTAGVQQFDNDGNPVY